MELKIIGHWGGYPGVDGASSTYLLSKNDFHLVLDLGSGGLGKLQKYVSVTDINAVILSHFHADHVADVGVLQQALLVQSFLKENVRPLPIYAHKENELAFGQLTDEFTEAKAYNPENTIKIGPFFIRFLRTKHSVPCFGMRITDGDSTIVYTADSAYQDEWIKFSKDADLFLAEANFYKGQDAAKAGHMTSEEVAIIAKKAQVKEVILTHLPHFGNHDQLLKETKEVFTGPVSLAKEGLTWSKKS